jgi:spore coat protein CotH
MPFKLDFDEFEDDYPDIDNQRFYGFQQLSLGNNFGDDAMMRDALAYDVYDEAGLAAASTGFYQVFLDFGEGPVNLGLYTVVEVIDDTVIARVFGDDSGNIYEGDGRAVSLAAGTTPEQIEDSFEKENNEEEGDWSDILALFDVLHAAERTEDPAAWREKLETVFDVDTFLKWLAVSAQIGHWDTYGGMSHNFYLYNNSQSGQLTWITWDHNLTFASGMGGMRGFGGPGGAEPNVTAGAAPDSSKPGPAAANALPMNRGGFGRGVSLDKADVGQNWPLIRFLLDDPVYHERYVDYMAETSALLDPGAMTERIETYAALLAPYVEAEGNGEAYASAVQRVVDYVTTRAGEVQTFLEEQ